MKKLLQVFSVYSLIFIFLSIVIFVVVSCQKESGNNSNIPEGQQRLRIMLSDNPVDFDAVNVDIQTVEVLVIPDSCRGNSGGDDNNDHGCHYDHHHDYDHNNYSCSVWDTLDIRPGVYNLLDLSNGVDTILASGFTVQGSIKKIRLTLGTQNSVVVDSVSYPLMLWSGYDRVTINVRGGDIYQVTPTELQLWLDFDAGRSIVKLSNNRFVLKPFLRIWLPSQTSAVKGKVVPGSAHALVSVIANNDTLVAFPEHDGRFKIRGVRGSTADVFINATANNYQDTTITGINLVMGQTTDIGAIQLHQ
ncbi:MAG TPA: DUF4382 domain-containing protein [Chitinophagaceae bacterium]|nr:DUF4382 domain-containing protein [Chitinophagaceae bacterium]